jgi:AraC-like DNA-binding protein
MKYNKGMSAAWLCGLGPTFCYFGRGAIEMESSDRPRYVLGEELAIRKLVTFYYREMPRWFYTSGEKHDFWEFVYVDNGELEVFTDSGRHHLSQGDMIFYKPNLFHGGKAFNSTAPNLIILSFECNAPCMAFFEDKSFRLHENERLLLSRIVQEGLQSFDPPINSPHLAGCPSKRDGAAFGGDQLIRNYLEILLIELIRKGETGKDEAKLSSVSVEQQGDEFVSSVVGYLQNNLAHSFKFDQLCEEFAISRTRMKALFRAKHGIGVMEYFNRLKIEQAKRLIREESATVSEIAERLGYSSLHYFSKQFKRIMDMTPSEYARSITARAERIRGKPPETADSGK